MERRLAYHMRELAKLLRDAATAETVKEEAADRARVRVATETPLDFFPLPDVVLDGLNESGLMTIGELVALPEAELRRLPNVGPARVRKTLAIRDAVECVEGLMKGRFPLTHQGTLDRLEYQKKIAYRDGFRAGQQDAVRLVEEAHADAREFHEDAEQARRLYLDAVREIEELKARLDTAKPDPV